MFSAEDAIRLCEEAPPMRCGACGGQMAAKQVTWSVLTMMPSLEFFDDEKPLWRQFMPKHAEAGEFKYVCSQCGIALKVRQRVDRSEGRMRFIGPEEKGPANEQ